MTLEGLNEDFRDLLVLLADGGVEFVPAPANAQRLFDVLVRFGAPLDSAGVTAGDFTQPGTVYQIGLPPRRIDLMTEISGLSARVGHAYSSPNTRAAFV